MICKECSLCRRGFKMVRPCERVRDTVCQEKCRSPVEFGDVFSIRCKKEYITEGNQYQEYRLIKLRIQLPYDNLNQLLSKMPVSPSR